MRHFILLLCFCLNFTVVKAQGVCDINDSSVEKGGFDIQGGITGGCSPLNVKLINTSGISNVKYDFDYGGEPAANLNGDPFDTETLFATANPKTYTILQYGIKNGKPMYACKKVVVRTSIDFSYSLCNVGFEPGNTFKTATIGIQFPAEAEITGSNIKYVLGTNPETTVPNLPYETTPQTIRVPTTLKVYAVGSGGVPVCSKDFAIEDVQTSPFRAEITQLEMITADKASLTLNGSFATPKYKLYRAESDADFFATRLEIGEVSPGTFEVNIPDLTKSYCFMVERPEVCGGWERPPDICTIPIDTIQYFPNQNIVNWLEHRPLIFNFHYSGVPVSRSISTSLIREEVGTGTTNFTPISTPFTDNIDCQKDYCYQVVSEITDLWSSYNYSSKSISLKRCISRENILATPLTLAMTTVDNTIRVLFSDNSAWPIARNKFFLYHKNAGLYEKIDSTLASGIPQFDVNLPTTKSQCFKIGFIDNCGSSSQLSPEICTINLNTDDISLFWTAYCPFSEGSIQDYTVENYTETNDLGTTFPPNTLFVPDLSLETDIVQYRIRATDSYGNISYSNIAELSPEFAMHLPNVFSPNNDGLNDTFKILGKKAMIDTFLLEVYNRWGEKLISFDEKDFEWDGKVDGKDLDVGQYVLKTRIQLSSGEILKQNFELLIIR